MHSQTSDSKLNNCPGTNKSPKPPYMAENKNKIYGGNIIKQKLNYRMDKRKKGQPPLNQKTFNSGVSLNNQTSLITAKNIYTDNSII